MRWAEHAARMEEMTSMYAFVSGKYEEMRPLGRLPCRWKDNIDLKEVGWEVVDWIQLAQYKGPVRTVMEEGGI